MKNSRGDRFRKTLILTFAIVAVLGNSGVAADTAEIRSLIEQLDSPKFAQRNSASGRLRTLGQTAIDALGEAARNGNREVSGRSFDILAAHLNSADSDVKQSARAMLDDLSKGDDAATALKARKILEPPKPEPGPSLGFGVRPNGIRAANALGQLRVQIKLGGGNKKIDVTQNNKRTIIEKKADGSIEVSESIGAGAAKKQTYKNIDELKKKNAEAHRLYESYGRGMIKIQGGKALLPQPKPAEQAKQDAIDKMLESLQNSIDRLKQRQKESNTPDQLQKSIDTLEKQKLSIEQMKERAKK